MCLIIDRPSGKRINLGLIDNGLHANPHGWGIMAAGGGEIITRRGLRARDFYRNLEDFGDLSLTVHFRWATHGPKNKDNTHPFVFGDRQQYALMHNGMIDIPIRDKGRSDTYNFVKYELEPLLLAKPEMFGQKGFEKMLSVRVGRDNKLVILRADGHKVTINANQGLEYNGLWLSNGHSLPREDEETNTTWDLTDLAAMDERSIADTCGDFPEYVAALIKAHFETEYMVRKSLRAWRDHELVEVFDNKRD